MSDVSFFKEVDLIFEEYLSPKKEKLQIRVKNISQNKILSETEMAYSKVFFDADLNIYKINKEGTVVKVENSEFVAVVMQQK